MEYVYLAVSLFEMVVMVVIAYTATKTIKKLERIIGLKERIIQEKSQHEEYLQEVVDQLVHNNRELKKKRSDESVSNEFNERILSCSKMQRSKKEK